MNGLPWITHCRLSAVDRVDQVDRTVQCPLRPHADHFGHQLHQASLAPVGIPVQAAVAGQESLPFDRIVGAPDRMQ